MVQKIDIQSRLRLLSFTEEMRQSISHFHPVFLVNIEDIIMAFYAHIESMPEGQKIFADKDVVERLKPRQKQHWLKLFSCDFDQSYVAAATHIGQVHFDNAIPPYIYMSGYNYFHCQVIDVALRNYRDKFDISDLLQAIARLIGLDMELALSAYTRSYWGSGRTSLSAPPVAAQAVVG